MGEQGFPKRAVNTDSSTVETTDEAEREAGNIQTSVLHTPDPLEGILLVYSGQPQGHRVGQRKS